MTKARTILFVHATTHPDAQLIALSDALGALGVKVSVRHLDARYQEMLDDIEASDSVVYWRGSKIS